MTYAEYKEACRLYYASLGLDYRPGEILNVSLNSYM